MSTARLSEGDFTQSEHWPRVRYGMPDKADILDAQNQTMAKFMIKEAEKREADQKINVNKFEQLYKLMAVIAEKVGVTDEDIKQAKPSRDTAGKAKVKTDKEVVGGLDETFQEEVLLLTSDYVDASDVRDNDLLKQNDSKRVGQLDLVGQWATHIGQKIRHQFKADWQGLTEQQRKLLYFVMAKAYFHRKKGGQPATPVEPGRASGSNVPQPTPTQTLGKRAKRRKVVESEEEEDDTVVSRSQEDYSMHGLDGTYDPEPRDWRPSSAKTVRYKPSLVMDARRPSVAPPSLFPPSTLDGAADSPYARGRQISIFQHYAETTVLPGEDDDDDTHSDEGEEDSDEQKHGDDDASSQALLRGIESLKIKE